MRSVSVTIVCLTALLAVLMSPPPPSAEERRCSELGANCVCSEPLNGTLRRIGSSWYNPDDSKTLECSVENFSIPELRGAALTRNSDDLVAAKESSILGALPAGHRINTVVRAPERYSGLWFVGHYFGDDKKFLKRMAVRWYRYYSPNYEISPADNPACDQRGKITEAHINYTSFGTGFTAYNFLKWTPNGRDCCSETQTAYPTVNQLRGKWWRFEYVMTNRNGPGHNSRLYVTNVTDRRPEQLIHDFSRLNFWSPQFTPPSPVRELRISQYTQGTCAGFAAISHFMVGGWDTDSEQRIGPAYEIEGGGS